MPAWKKTWVAGWKDIKVPAWKKIWTPIWISEWVPFPKHEEVWDRSSQSIQDRSSNTAIPADSSTAAAEGKSQLLGQVGNNDAFSGIWKFPQVIASAAASLAKSATNTPDTKQSWAWQQN